MNSNDAAMIIAFLWLFWGFCGGIWVVFRFFIGFFVGGKANGLKHWGSWFLFNVIVSIVLVAMYGGGGV